MENLSKFESLTNGALKRFILILNCQMFTLRVERVNKNPQFNYVFRNCIESLGKVILIATINFRGNFFFVRSVVRYLVYAWTS